MNYTETRVAREEIYDGKILHVTCDTVRLPNGENAPREVAWHRGAVAVLPVTDAGEIVLVEQYRYAMGKLLLEIPAGKLEAGESNPLSAAKRELSEETGYTAAEWISFGEYYGSPAVLSERIYLYLARGLTPGEMHLDDD